MFHYMNTAQNAKGDALPGWFIEAVVVGTDTVVPIYADAGGTLIESVSGVNGRAKVNTSGNYDFWCDTSPVDFKVYNSAGAYQKRLTSVQMPVAQDYLAASDGVGLAGFSQPSGLTRTALSKLRDTVSMFDIIPAAYHAAITAGTSTDDVYTYFEQASQNYASILVPKGRYYTSKCPRIYSNTELIGAGPDTVIYNPQTDAGTQNRCGFDVGNQHPAMWDYANRGTGDNLLCHDVSDFVAGQYKFTFTTSGDSANYSVGQFVWLRSVAETTVGSFQQPNFVQLTKVRSVGTGTITVEDPANESVTGACISPIGTVNDPVAGRPWDVVENVKIANMSISARYAVWTRPGMYRSILRDITMLNSEGLMGLNAFTKSIAENISGPFTARCLEIKCGSDGSFFRNVRGVYAGTGSVLSGVEIGEQSHNLTLEDCGVEITEDATSGVNCLGINGRHIKIVRGRYVNNATTGSASGAVAYVAGNNYTGYGPENVSLRDVELVGSVKRTYHLIVGDDAATLGPNKVVLDGINYIGAVANQNVQYRKSTNVTVTNAKGAFTTAVTSSAEWPRDTDAVARLVPTAFSILSGTPALTSFASGTGLAWALDSAATETICTMIPVPAWANAAQIVGYFANLGAGAGDVRVTMTLNNHAAGETMGTSGVATSTTITAGAQNVLQKVTLGTAATDAGGVLMVRFARIGADAADTLANDYGLVNFEVRWRQ